MADLEEYYKTDYRILLGSEEEDQLYAVREGRPVYRADHQAKTFLAAVELPVGARILDFGAAKGATIRRVLASRPDVRAHFFDVSDMYVPFWRRIVPDGAFATHHLPQSWSHTFDVVVSFFVLEHVEQPVNVLSTVRSLLRPGGVAYVLVPNPAVNIADFVVVDHVNHFTASSLERTLVGAGLDAVTLDAVSHEGAWVARGERPCHDNVLSNPPGDVASSVATAQQLATYWTEVAARIGAAERSVADHPAAVYGAGFYGSFIRTNLERPERIVAYVDQNPHLQGTEHFGRPVVAPADLDPAVGDVYVGLNPNSARSIIDGITGWQDRALRFHYL
jgi:SAM-dependent methyltransferase